CAQFAEVLKLQVKITRRIHRRNSVCRKRFQHQSGKRLTSPVYSLLHRRGKTATTRRQCCHISLPLLPPCVVLRPIDVARFPQPCRHCEWRQPEFLRYAAHVVYIPRCPLHSHPSDQITQRVFGNKRITRDHLSESFDCQPVVASAVFRGRWHFLVSCRQHEMHDFVKK